MAHEDKLPKNTVKSTSYQELAALTLRLKLISKKFNLWLYTSKNIIVNINHNDAMLLVTIQVHVATMHNVHKGFQGPLQ